MLRNTAARTITTLYSANSSNTGLIANTEININSQYANILVDNNLHAKTRVFFGVNLLLLMLSHNKPEEYLEGTKSIYKIIFSIDAILNPEFAKELMKSFVKHFQVYSSNASIELVATAEKSSLILFLPSKVVNENWNECVKSEATLSNPDYHKQFPAIAIKMLTELGVKVAPCITLESLSTLNNLYIECKFIHELIQVFKSLLKTNLLDASIVESDMLCGKINEIKINLVASIIDAHFNIPDRVANKNEIVNLIATCIAKKSGFMEFLKYKIKQNYENMRSTDRRIAVYILAGGDISSVNARRVQHGIFVMCDVDEGFTTKEYEDVFITEVAHYDAASRIQVVFANNTSLPKLDLHGFDVPNAKKLANIFLERHFNNFTHYAITIDVGKASHSPNNISRLAHPIEKLLPYYVKSGIIESFEAYNQETGHLIINLPNIRYIKLPEELVQNTITAFKVASKTLPGTIKSDIKSAIKSNLKYKLNDPNPIRVRIKFPLKIEDLDLIACLEKDVVRQQVEELFSKMKITIKINSENDSFYIMISKSDLSVSLGGERLKLGAF